MNILMVGIKASGKGTQAKLLSEKYAIPHISSGDLFRKLDPNSDLGKKIRSYIDKGKYVPDELTLNLVLKRLDEPVCQKGFILDGFPRTLNQAKVLEGKYKLDKVIVIKVSRKEAMKRITGRRICSNKDCQASYNLYTAPKPKSPDICDKCGSELIQRKDETKEAATNRINTDIKESTPMLEFYRAKGIVIEINGEQSIEDVQKEIQQKLKQTK